jgi:hypothetical protein
VLRRMGAIVALVISIVVVAPSSPTVAAEICKGWFTNSEGVLTYGTVPCPSSTPGEDGDDGGGSGGGGPSCYLGRAQAFDYDVAFCRGDLSCYQYVPTLTYPEPADWPAKPAGTDENAIYSSEACFTQPPDESLVSYDYVWTVPDEPTLEQQADEAYGNLRAPGFTLAFNPPTRAVVSLPTWFWADGAPAIPLRGSSAAGLVAVATPDHMEVDPGDGTGVQTCDFSVEKSESCASTYNRSSVGQPHETSSGEPAYTARMRLVYRVAFELGGAPMTIPGAPETFTSTWQDTLVPVAEVESLVTRG